MKLFDLHCDTISEMKKLGCTFRDNPLHISERKAEIFSPYVQVAAVWSDSSLSDGEAWENFFSVTEYFKKVTGIEFITDREKLEGVAEGVSVILACEGARLLSGDISRLDRLFSEGVRVLTLTWAGNDIIGGAHGSELGLTPFGRDVVERCFDLGIIPDVSHASRRTAREVFGIAERRKKAPVATHSNSYAVHSHQRNLTDEEFSYIISLGGIAGISLAAEHLAPRGCADIPAVADHVMHYIRIGGVSSVALGCDFDGVSVLPEGISDISCLDRLWDALSGRGLSEDDIECVFFSNAYRFMKENL